MAKRSDDRWKNAGDATTAAPQAVLVVVAAAAAAAPRARDSCVGCTAPYDRRRYGSLKRVTGVPTVACPACPRNTPPETSRNIRVVYQCVRLGVPAHNLYARAVLCEATGLNIARRLAGAHRRRVSESYREKRARDRVRRS